MDTLGSTASRIRPPEPVSGVLGRITQKVQETLNRAIFLNGELDRVCGAIPADPSPEPNGNSAVDVLEHTIDKLWAEINTAANRVQAL